MRLGQRTHRAIEVTESVCDSLRNASIKVRVDASFKVVSMHHLNFLMILRARGWNVTIV